MTSALMRQTKRSRDGEPSNAAPAHRVGRPVPNDPALGECLPHDRSRPGDVISDVTGASLVAMTTRPIATEQDGKGRTERKRTGNTGHQRSLPVTNGHSKTAPDLASHALTRFIGIERMTVRFPPAPPRVKNAHLSVLAWGDCVTCRTSDVTTPLTWGFGGSRCWGESSETTPFARTSRSAGCEIDRERERDPS